jgi:curved DNA-binding protein CbpA
MTENYYQVLGVSYDTSEEEIKQVYRRLAKQYHPDVNQGDLVKEDQFKRISEAYDTLSDKDKRSSYDFWLLLQMSEQNDDTDHTSGTWQYQEPIWPRYKSYKKEPVTYSKRTYLTATVLVSIVFLTIFLIPVFLVKYSSVFHYEEAVESYKQGNYYAALNSLDHAILEFGERTPEACLLTTVILMEEYSQFNEAINYAEIGIDHTDSPSEQAKLLYLKGKSLKENGAYRLAIDAFTQALKLWPGTDTNRGSMNITDVKGKNSQFEPMIVSQLTREKMLYAIGDIYAFFQNDYTRAIVYFNELIATGNKMPEAYYGRGYCYYKLQKNTEAIADFNAYIQQNPTHGMAFYFRGRAHLQLNQLEDACHDFQQAQALDTQEGIRMQARYCQ